MTSLLEMPYNIHCTWRNAKMLTLRFRNVFGQNVRVISQDIFFFATACENCSNRNVVTFSPAIWTLLSKNVALFVGNCLLNATLFHFSLVIRFEINVSLKNVLYLFSQLLLFLSASTLNCGRCFTGEQRAFVYNGMLSEIWIIAICFSRKLHSTNCRAPE